jgi:hypothetical protein
MLVALLTKIISFSAACSAVPQNVNKINGLYRLRKNP